MILKRIWSLISHSAYTAIYIPNLFLSFDAKQIGAKRMILHRKHKKRNQTLILTPRTVRTEDNDRAKLNVTGDCANNGRPQYGRLDELRVNLGEGCIRLRRCALGCQRMLNCRLPKGHAVYANLWLRGRDVIRISAW